MLGRRRGAIAVALLVLSGCSSSNASLPTGVTLTSEPRPSPSLTYGGATNDQGVTAVGSVQVDVPSGEDVEVLGVRVNATDGVEIMEVLAVPTSEENWGGGPPPTGGGGSGWPPEERYIGEHSAAVGELVPADAFDSNGRLQVLVGLRATNGETQAVNGVDVSYRIDGKTEEQTFDHALIFCMDSAACQQTLDEDPEQTLRALGLVRVES